MIAVHGQKEEETLSLPVPNNKTSVKTLIVPNLRSMCFGGNMRSPLARHGSQAHIYGQELMVSLIDIAL